MPADAPGPQCAVSRSVRRLIPLFRDTVMPSSDATTSFNGLVAVSHASFATGHELLGAVHARLGAGAAASIRRLVERARTRDTLVGGRFTELEPVAWYPPECLPEATVTLLQQSLDREASQWAARGKRRGKERGKERGRESAESYWAPVPSDIVQPHGVEDCAGIIDGARRVHNVVFMAGKDGFGWIAEANSQMGVQSPYIRIRTVRLPVSVLVGGEIDNRTDVRLVSEAVSRDKAVAR